MSPRWTLPLLLAVGAASSAVNRGFVTDELNPNLHATVLRNPEGSCEVLSFTAGETYRLLESDSDLKVETRRQTVDRELDQFHSGRLDNAAAQVIDLWSRDLKVIQGAIQYKCPNGYTDVSDSSSLVPQGSDDSSVAPTDEPRLIIRNGDPLNRIDVVFMGDGYTLAEKEKFFKDIERLASDMFEEVTFKSWLPLFNIWAVFRESQQSGIGVGGKAIPGAAFGLYRDGTELRGIYCSKSSAARDACKSTGAGACDFPSLIGNDPYYGGLGGEFVISTSSPTSGTIVLRHELGHNFGNVGEEYDGGSAYSGANSASSVNSVAWSHWLTQPLREENQVLRAQKYAWYDLAKGPYVIKFKSDGKFASWLMRLSASGVDQPGSFIVTLDGEPLAWKTTGILDRSFFTWEGKQGLSAGDHVLEFKSGFAPAPGRPIRQLCSVTLHEYAADFLFDPKVIGAYPTFDVSGRKTMRPNNEYCLMRNMTSDHFCSVCSENNFLRFLSRVSLIDAFTSDTYCQGKGVARTSLRIDAVPLAQFRPASSRIAGEKYTLKWTKDGKAVPQFDDMFELDLAYEDTVGTWVATLSLTTPEIRKDTKGVTTASKTIKIAAGLNKC